MYYTFLRRITKNKRRTTKYLRISYFFRTFASEFYFSCTNNKYHYHTLPMKKFLLFFATLWFTANLMASTQSTTGDKPNGCAFLSIYPTVSSLMANGDDDEKAAWILLHRQYPKMEYLYFGNVTAGKLAAMRMCFFIRDVDTKFEDVFTLPEIAQAAAPVIGQWVKNGGNLCLWGHACVYIGTIGRFPAKQFNDEAVAVGTGTGNYNPDTWYTAVSTYTESGAYANHIYHPLFDGLQDIYSMSTWDHQEDIYLVPFKGPGWSEDHNCCWFDRPSSWTGEYNYSQACYDKLVNEFGVTPLGTWDGQTSWFSQLNIWEAGPARTPNPMFGGNTFRGKVLCIGNGGCEIAMNNPDGSEDLTMSVNRYQRNVNTLLFNAVNYLMGTPRPYKLCINGAVDMPYGNYDISAGYAMLEDSLGMYSATVRFEDNGSNESPFYLSCVWYNREAMRDSIVRIGLSVDPIVDGNAVPLDPNRVNQTKVAPGMYKLKVNWYQQTAWLEALTPDEELTDGESWRKNKNCANYLTYTRQFEDTTWQPLYLPFRLDYDEWKDDFEVAFVNGVRQMDTDHDGVIDYQVLDAIPVNEGSLRIEFPYLIRAKQIGSHTFTSYNTYLAESDMRWHYCNTLSAHYSILGCKRSTAYDEVSYYFDVLFGMSDGELTEYTQTLNPYRWYVGAEYYLGYRISAAAAARIHVQIVEHTDKPCGVSNTTSGATDGPAYNILGQPVDDTYRGVVIRKGQKQVRF